jgi:hypothetical protein
MGFASGFCPLCVVISSQARKTMAPTLACLLLPAGLQAYIQRLRAPWGEMGSTYFNNKVRCEAQWERAG